MPPTTAGTPSGLLALAPPNNISPLLGGVRKYFAEMIIFVAVKNKRAEWKQY
jgi:hypothetical protein